MISRRLLQAVLAISLFASGIKAAAPAPAPTEAERPTAQASSPASVAATPSITDYYAQAAYAQAIHASQEASALYASAARLNSARTQALVASADAAKATMEEADRKAIRKSRALTRARARITELEAAATEAAAHAPAAPAARRGCSIKAVLSLMALAAMTAFSAGSAFVAKAHADCLAHQSFLSDLRYVDGRLDGLKEMHVHFDTCLDKTEGDIDNYQEALNLPEWQEKLSEDAVEMCAEYKDPKEVAVCHKMFKSGMTSVIPGAKRQVTNAIRKECLGKPDESSEKEL